MFGTRMVPATRRDTANQADPPPARPIFAELMNRIRSEYLEMPGLHLTARQARRLWDLESPVCDALLGALVGAGFLRQTTEGGYVRVDSGY